MQQFWEFKLLRRLLAETRVPLLLEVVVGSGVESK